MVGKLLVTKISADGEQVAFEISNVPFEQMKELSQQLNVIADARMYEMNMRMLESTKLLNTLTSDERMRFRAILDVLYGRGDPEHIYRGLKSYMKDLEEAGID